MRRATSLQTPPHPYAHARPTATVAVNGIARGAWCTRMAAAMRGLWARCDRNDIPAKARL